VNCLSFDCLSAKSRDKKQKLEAWHPPVSSLKPCLSLGKLHSQLSILTQDTKGTYMKPFLPQLTPYRCKLECLPLTFPIRSSEPTRVEPLKVLHSKSQHLVLSANIKLRQMEESYKHTSLLRYGINYVCKKIA